MMPTSSSVVLLYQAGFVVAVVGSGGRLFELWHRRARGAAGVGRRARRLTAGERRRVPR